MIACEWIRQLADRLFSCDVIDGAVTVQVKCEICKRHFAQDSYLKEHMRQHNDDRPFPCTECPMKFAYASYLERHMRTHTGNELTSSRVLAN